MSLSERLLPRWLALVTLCCGTRRGSCSRPGERSARAIGSRGSGGRASSRSASAAPALGPPAGPPAVGRGRRVLGAPQRWRGAPPPRLRRLSVLSSPPPPSLSGFFGKRCLSLPVPRGPHAERGGSSFRALRGCAGGAALPAPAGSEPSVGRGTSPAAAKSPALSPGTAGPRVPSFFPRQPRLASRCSRKWPERRLAASNASDGSLPSPGEETEAQKGAGSNSGVLCLPLTSMKLWHAGLFVCK
ncbi:collagen alpha-1(I) chain-like [Panthera tigris]|uniref:collagen alpha-1(I) chain-like n=1 Tax=Panthera tigris TaxID=9694 RepID=UPI001C6F7031|nr:collagen alpha-1(I) chain-like [Panthera tigris]